MKLLIIMIFIFNLNGLAFAKTLNKNGKRVYLVDNQQLFDFTIIEEKGPHDSCGKRP